MVNLSDGLQFANKHKGSIAAGLGLAAVGGAGIYALSKHKSKKRSKKNKRSYYRASRRRKQRKPYTAGKRRDSSHRRIRFTKRGQPYIITSSGRAKFIKMSSAKRSRKLKGGRY